MKVRAAEDCPPAPGCQRKASCMLPPCVEGNSMAGREVDFRLDDVSYNTVNLAVLSVGVFETQNWKYFKVAIG